MSYNIGGEPLILPRGEFEGFRLSFVNAGELSIGPGQAKDSTNVANIINTSTLSVNWTHLDQGSEAADTLYTVYLIIDSSGTNPIDRRISTSTTAPTLPAGYDLFVRVGSFRNNNSQDIIEFRQIGNGKRRRIIYNDELSNLEILSNGAAQVPTPVNFSSLVPSTSRTLLAGIIYQQDDHDDFVQFRETGMTMSNSALRFTQLDNKNRDGYGIVELPLNENQSLDYWVSDVDDDLFISVVGYYDEY